MCATYPLTRRGLGNGVECVSLAMPPHPVARFAGMAMNLCNSADIFRVKTIPFYLGNARDSALLRVLAGNYGKRFAIVG